MSTNVYELGALFTANTGSFTAGADRVERRMTALGQLAQALETRMLALNVAMDAFGVSAGLAATGGEALAEVLAALRAEVQSTNRAFGARAPAAYAGNLDRSALAAEAATSRTRALAIEVNALNAAMSANRGLRGPVGPPALPGGGAGGGGGRGFGRGMTGMGVRELGGAISNYVGVPLLAGVGVSGVAFAGFEAAMTKLQAYAGTSRAEVKALTPEVLRLAEATGQLPVELAKALFFIESMGIHGRNAMDLLTVSSRASAGGLGEVKDVALAITQIMQAYGGKQGLTPGVISDIVAKGAVIAHRPPEELFKSMGQTLPIASALNIQFRDLMAAEAILTREGYSSAQGYTALRQVMNSLAAPTEKMKKMFKEIDPSGVFNAGKLRKDMQKDLYGGMMELFNKTHGNVETMMNTLGARRGGGALLAIVNPDSQTANKKAFDDMHKVAGTTDKAFAATAKNVAFHWKQAMVSAINAAIEFGGAVKGQLISVADHFKSVFDAFQRLPDATKRTTAELALAGGATALLGGKLLALAPAISSAIGLMGRLGPQGVLVVAAITAGVASGTAMWATNFAGFRDKVKGIFADLGAFWKKYGAQAITTLSDMWTIIRPVFAAMSSFMMSVFGIAIKYMISQVSTFVELFDAACTGIRVMFGDGMAGIKDAAAIMAGSVIATFASMARGALSWVANLVNGAAQMMSGGLIKGIPVFAGADAALAKTEAGGNAMASGGAFDLMHRLVTDQVAEAKRQIHAQRLANEVSNFDPLAMFKSSGRGGGGKGFDLGKGGGGGGGGKGKKGGKSDEEKNAEDLKSKIEELTKAIRLHGNESEAAALKDDILFGQFASAAQKAKGLQAAMKALSGKEYDQASKSLFGTSYDSLSGSKKQEAAALALQTHVETMTENLDRAKKTAEAAKKVIDDANQKAVDIHKELLMDAAKRAAGAGSELALAIEKTDQPLKKLSELAKGVAKDIHAMFMATSTGGSRDLFGSFQWIIDGVKNLRDAAKKVKESFDDMMQASRDRVAESKGAEPGTDPRQAFIQKKLDEYLRSEKEKRELVTPEMQGQAKDQFGKEFDAQQIANYRDQMQGLTEEVLKYTKGADAARKAAMDWDVQQGKLTKDQAAHILLMEKYVEKLKAWKERITQMSEAGAQMVQNIFDQFVQHGGRGLAQFALKQVQDYFHQMASQALGNLAKGGLTGILGKVFKMPGMPGGVGNATDQLSATNQLTTTTDKLDTTIQRLIQALLYGQGGLGGQSSGGGLGGLLGILGGGGSGGGTGPFAGATAGGGVNVGGASTIHLTVNHNYSGPVSKQTQDQASRNTHRSVLSAGAKLAKA